MINKEIFRSYDIRGIVGKELKEEDAEILGQSFGTYIQQLGEKTVIVGYDCRESSVVLCENLINGLIASGTNVINIGLATTPMLYYARKFFDIGPAIQITASHNPKEYNGFKLCINKEEESIFGEEIQNIRRFTEKNNFIKNNNGIVENKSIIDEYINEIISRIQLGKRKLKVVVDSGNGTASIIAEKLLRKLGIEVVPLYCNIDPSFPNHHPDPSVPENLQDLKVKVLETKADIGIGFDGDGDRIGLVDEKGNVILGDLFMIMIWRDIIKNYPATKALVEVKCSQSLWDELIKMGAKPQFIRTGNPYIKEAMRRENIPFSGEMSGHIFFRDEYYGFDDATYAAARILRVLSNTNKTTSELLEGINRYITTPELSIQVSDKEKFEIINKAIKYFKDKGYKVIDVDGARVIFKNGWGLTRASNTSPKITMRFEADSEENIETIKKEFDKCFKDIMKN